MTYQLRLKTSAKKELDKFPRQDKARILILLVKLVKNPYIGKKLEGKLKDFYSIRLWPYRIIYKIFKKELLVIVIKIGHRKKVYLL